MKISFYEEFPTRENMLKLRLVKFPTKVFVAASSFKEFQRIVKKYKQKNVTFGFWPVLDETEGYWVSPFVPQAALYRVLDEAAKAELILIDLELPKNRAMMLNVITFFSNRRLIRRFLQKHAHKVVTAEYGAHTRFLRFLGITSGKGSFKVGKMLYSSMRLRNIREDVFHLQKVFGNRLVVGLGCTTQGILGIEPVLSVSQLQKDLQVCKDANVKEVCIFRLGGLNKEYLKVIKGFTQQRVVHQ